MADENSTDLMTGGEQKSPDTEVDNTQSLETAKPTESDSRQNDDSDTKDGEQQKQGEEDKTVEYAEFKMPEGVHLDESALNEFKPVAQELGLNQEQAQKLVDLYAKNITAVNQQVDEQAKAFLAERTEKWNQAIGADKDFGGEKLQATATKVNKLLSTFDPENHLIEYLKETQAANCAPLFLMLARMTKHFEEDNIFGGTERSAQKEKQPYEKMGWD